MRKDNMSQSKPDNIIDNQPSQEIDGGDAFLKSLDNIISGGPTKGAGRINVKKRFKENQPALENEDPERIQDLPEEEVRKMFGLESGEEKEEGLKVKKRKSNFDTQRDLDEFLYQQTKEIRSSETPSQDPPQSDVDTKDSTDRAIEVMTEGHEESGASGYLDRKRQDKGTLESLKLLDINYQDEGVEEPKKDGSIKSANQGNSIGKVVHLSNLNDIEKHIPNELLPKQQEEVRGGFNGNGDDLDTFMGDVL